MLDHPSARRHPTGSIALLVALAAGACTGTVGSVGQNSQQSPQGNNAASSASGGSEGTSSSSSSSGGSSVSTTGPSTAAPGPESPSPRLLRQLTLVEYTNTVTDLLQLTSPDTSSIPPDNPVDGYTTNVASNFVTQGYIDAYSTIAAALATRVLNESYAKVVSCQTQDAACTTTFLQTFGLKAFRRPLTSDEMTRYTALFDSSLTGGSFQTGVSLAIQAMLISPNFLFRSELGTAASNGTYNLTPYETATALSYAYWGTMPDATLFAAAQAGELSTKAQIQAQAQRLMADPRGRTRIQDFFYQWMQGSRANIATPDMGTYPNLYAASGGFQNILTSMRAEEDAFVANVAFDSTKKFSELLTANYTFANDALAGYYGLTPPGSATVAKVMIPPTSARGGLLTLGMFLLGHARTNESSPTQRGHQIRANLLCNDVPPPPPGVDPVVPAGTPGVTGREQIQAITGSGVCETCHSLMNPIGFGLEAFDGAGAERALDNGEPVDTTGQLTGFTNSSGKTITFDGARQLSNILSTYATAAQCFATNYYKYIRGFNPTGVDLGAAQQLSQNFAQNNQDLPDLFVDVSLQDSFIERRSAEAIAQ
jgi:hypothetical protein